MSTISLRLSQSLHRRVRDLAKQDGISINQFIATAIAEKMTALMTIDYRGERAKHGRRGKFERAMAKVRDIEPDKKDAL
jgi:hypothetical protein